MTEPGPRPSELCESRPSDRSSWPLVFKVGEAAANEPASRPEPLAAPVYVRCLSRALDGMQKESLVAHLPGGETWRILCDEGAYLHGTDVAPPPLFHFAAGLQFCLLCSLYARTSREGIEIEQARLQSDNRYSMQGSFLRGDAEAGAFPSEFDLEVDSNADINALAGIIQSLAVTCRGLRLLHTPLRSAFSLHLNGHRVAVEGLPEPSALEDPRLLDQFERITAAAADSFAPGILEKRRPPQSPDDVDAAQGDETGIGLQSEQRRRLHIRGETTWQPGQPAESLLHRLAPLGSSFRFLGEAAPDAPANRLAPDALAYISAGVAFCFMTQLGRYAAIRKVPLDRYAVIQKACFCSPNSSGEGVAAGDQSAAADEPFATHVFIEGDLSASDAAELVRMGERTCFLHATLRQALSPRMTLRQGGRRLILCPRG